MMQVEFAIDKSTTLKAQCQNNKEVVKTLSDWDNVFRHRRCGMCESDNTHLRHRLAQEYDFYEWHCHECNANLQMGQAKEGNGLFIRWDAEWERYQKPDGQQQTQQTQQQPVAAVSDSQIPF